MEHSPSYKPTQTEYATRDIYLCTTLKACGIHLLRVECCQGKGFFIFKYSPKIEALIADFHNGRLKVDAKTLFNTWKDMKSLAFSAVNRGDNQNGGIRYENSNHQS